MQEHHKKLFRQALADAKSRFNPEMGLVGSGSMGGSSTDVFRPAASLSFAQALLKEGDPDSVEIAAQIIGAVLDSQEQNPERPHCGNFMWLAGDPEVADLNAVQFVLRHLLPSLVLYGDLLPKDIKQRCRSALFLALAEEEQLDVSPSYTNIHLMSLFSLMIGAQWLGNSYYQHLGQSRWDNFVAYTIKSGAPHEYNSTNYGPVDISTLAALINLIDEPKVKLQAYLLYERFWLHLMLHFHMPTFQLAGPHCRSYWYPMTTGYSMMGDMIWHQTGWDQLLPPQLESGIIPIESLYALELLMTEHRWPTYLDAWLENQEKYMPYSVRETANLDEGDDLTTYFTPSYSMGTASKTYSIGTECFYIEHQANYLSIHYKRPEQPKPWGMVYSRFMVNDQHWGTLGAAHDRPKDANFYDQGNFASVQDKDKAVCQYALKPQHKEVTSLKMVVCFSVGADLKQIWVNGESVPYHDLPVSINVDDWLIVEDGDVYIGVRVLEFSNLGSGTGVKLEHGPLGELWLTVSHYKGAPKRFWEYASLGGAFWHGNIRSGYVIEVSEKTEHTNARTFLEYLKGAVIIDSINEEKVRSVTYKNAGERLRLDYDLMRTKPVARWINGEEYHSPPLQSPLAVQGADGTLSLGSATLQTNAQPVWLVAYEEEESVTWVAVNPQSVSTPLKLNTKFGEITSNEWKLGRVTWQAYSDGEGEVIVEGLEKPGDLMVPFGVNVNYQIFGFEDSESNDEN